MAAAARVEIHPSSLNRGRRRNVFDQVDMMIC
jgi:hypothetical protein